MVGLESNALFEEFRERYDLLISALKEAKHTDHCEKIDEAFSRLIVEKGKSTTFFGKGLIIHILDSALIAVKEIGLGNTSVISLFLYHSGSGDTLDLTKIKEEYGDQEAIIADGLTKVYKIDEAFIIEPGKRCSGYSSTPGGSNCPYARNAVNETPGSVKNCS
jgi:(p)ppGpp synthase/HD superfamily hydrolase